MLKEIELIFLLYIAIISVISFIVCVYDKIAAKKFTKHRTRESTLLLLSALVQHRVISIPRACFGIYVLPCLLWIRICVICWRTM